jgi:hypothetical protein
VVIIINLAIPLEYSAFTKYGTVKPHIIVVEWYCDSFTSELIGSFVQIQKKSAMSWEVSSIDPLWKRSLNSLISSLYICDEVPLCTPIW